MMLYHAIKGFRVFMAPLNLVVSFSVFGLSVLNTALTSANVYSLDYLILCTEENQSKKKLYIKKISVIVSNTYSKNDERKSPIHNGLGKI